MAFTQTDNSSPASLGVGNSLPTNLMELLQADAIQPGAQPSYQLCKTIFVDHPLGQKMAQSPVKMAQSQPRDIQIPGAPEKELKERFDDEWKRLKAGSIIRNCMTLSRVYGIASLAVREKDTDPAEPLDMARVAERDIYFNVLDPLNTAGSLVLNQDPNSDDFLKPTGITVAGKKYHPSRAVVVMNEEPVYIEWTSSAFGFVGRSVYQRALYPLKSFVQTMVTDNAVTEKAALLVAKTESPGGIMDRIATAFGALRRTQIKGAKTGNVIQIGKDEAIESLDLHNLRDAAEFARDNILKNTATAADMPASFLNQETLAEGFGEGSEDAKNIARYIDTIRQHMEPLYTFMDRIVMRRAWDENFYRSLQRKYPDVYGQKPYETAFYEWSNAFAAVWPNLLTEPDSKKIEVQDVVLKAAIGVYEVMAPTLDPQNRAMATAWLADVINENPELFESRLDIDLDLLMEYEPPDPIEPTEPAPESRLV